MFITFILIISFIITTITFSFLTIYCHLFLLLLHHLLPLAIWEYLLPFIPFIPFLLSWDNLDLMKLLILH